MASAQASEGMGRKPLANAIFAAIKIDIESECHTLFSRVLYQLSYLAWSAGRPALREG